MSGNEAEAFRSDFEQWLNGSPKNAEHYARVDRTHALVQNFSDAREILALRHETLSRTVLRRLPHMSNRAFAAGISVLIIMGSFYAFQDQTTVNRIADKKVEAPGTVYRTAVGERLSVTLPDGSAATLNTGSRLRVAYTANERRLFIEEGQVLFEVAKGQARPFRVVARDQAITAHGTAFDVRLTGKAVEIALIEGEVVVARHDDRSARSTRLKPNDLLTVGGATVSIKRIPNIARVTSWREGIVVLEDEKLADAVAEINRYVVKPIVLADESLADLQVSGAFRVGETAGFLEALELGFPVRVTERTEAHMVTAAPRG